MDDGAEGEAIWGRGVLSLRMVFDTLCLLMSGQDIAQKMLDAPSPKEHKALGRKVKGFDRAKWDERACSYLINLIVVRCEPRVTRNISQTRAA